MSASHINTLISLIARQPLTISQNKPRPVPTSGKAVITLRGSPSISQETLHGGFLIMSKYLYLMIFVTRSMQYENSNDLFTIIEVMIPES